MLSYLLSCDGVKGGSSVLAYLGAPGQLTAASAEATRQGVL